jgi:hypothetical protein
MKSKENVPLPDKEPIPVDVRKPRFNENSDIFMKDLEAQPKQAPEKSITLQDYKNRTKNPDGKKFESSADQTRTGPRQSELSIKVDSNEVIKNILDTPVSISIGNLLGTSRDLAVKVNDMIRYKNPIMPTTQKVYNTQMRQEDSEMEPSMPPIEQSKRIKNFSRMLILIKLYCYGNPIWATVDTGSQINVVSKRIADKHIRLPVDISKQIIISDVNGNSGTVTEMINSAPLRCGNVITEATELYVAENLPCELLLGRPWQRGNLVSIDERPEGTYLVFKDPKTLKPRYEMHIAPEDVVPDTKFRPYMNAKVYTAIDVAEDKSEQLSHQVTIDNQTPIFESIEQFHLTQSDVKDITLEDWSQVKSYTDTELSDHKLFQIPLYNKNALITTIIDTGALVNIVDKRIVERLIREPINPYRTGVVYDQEGVPIKLVGTINNVPLTCGMANIMVDEIYVGENLPFGLLLGHGWQSKYMPIVEERNTGTYIKIRSQLATGPTEFLTASKPPEVKWSKMSSTSNSMDSIEYDIQSDKEEDEEEEEPADQILADNFSLTLDSSDNLQYQDSNSDLIIGYGPTIPYAIIKKRQYTNFDYYIYLHQLPKPFTDDKLRMVYGNLPYHKMVLKEVNESHQEELCKRLMDRQLKFLIEIIRFYRTPGLKEKLAIPRNFLKYPFMDLNKSVFNAYDAFQFGEVNEIVMLATVILHRPQDAIKEIFYQKYPKYAIEIFAPDFPSKSPIEQPEDTDCTQILKIATEAKQQVTPEPSFHMDEISPDIEQEDGIGPELLFHNFSAKDFDEESTGTLKLEKIVEENQENNTGDMITYNSFILNRSETTNIYSETNRLMQNKDTSPQDTRQEGELLQTDQDRAWPQGQNMPCAPTDHPLPNLIEGRSMKLPESAEYTARGVKA